MRFGQLTNGQTISTGNYVGNMVIISVGKLKNFYATVAVTGVGNAMSTYTLKDGQLTSRSLSNTMITNCDYIIAFAGHNAGGTIQFTIKW